MTLQASKRKTDNSDEEEFLAKGMYGYLLTFYIFIKCCGLLLPLYNVLLYLNGRHQDEEIDQETVQETIQATTQKTVQETIQKTVQESKENA